MVVRSTYLLEFDPDYSIDENLEIYSFKRINNPVLTYNDQNSESVSPRISYSKIMLLILINIVAISLGLIYVINPYFYSKTQINFTVRADILKTIGNSTITTEDDFRVTLFCQDTKNNNKYFSYKVTFKDSKGKSSLLSDHSSPDLYMTWNSKIIELIDSNTALYKDHFDFFSEIIQEFAEHKLSSRYYSMECKENLRNWQGCDYSSINKQNENSLLKKKDDHNKDYI